VELNPESFQGWHGCLGQLPFLLVPDFRFDSPVIIRQLPENFLTFLTSPEAKLRFFPGQYYAGKQVGTRPVGSDGLPSLSAAKAGESFKR
jgi:hypothetical protein